MIQTNLFDPAPVPDTFYRTVPEEPGDRQRIGRQTARILGLFLNSPRTEFTPFAVCMHFGQQWPITSIRRAITDLTEWGYLEKTGNMRRELLGKMNHTWRLKI